MYLLLLTTTTATTTYVQVQPDKLFSAWCVAITDPKTKLLEFKQLLSQLPRTHYMTLAWVVIHMTHVIANVSLSPSHFFPPRPPNPLYFTPPFATTYSSNLDFWLMPLCFRKNFNENCFHDFFLLFMTFFWLADGFSSREVLCPLCFHSTPKFV